MSSTDNELEKVIAEFIAELADEDVSGLTDTNAQDEKPRLLMEDLQP